MYNLAPFFISIVFGILAVLTIIILIGMCRVIEEDVLESCMLRTYGRVEYEARKNR